jgi:hypothetical protein
VLAAYRLRSRVGGFPAACYLALAVGLLFIAGEEASWGQRILGFDGPTALVEANIQGESNLHNLLDRYALHAVYIAVGLWGSGLGRWVTVRVRWLQPGRLYAPGRELVWWFLPVTAYYLYLDYVGAPLLRLSGDPLEGDLVEMLANGPARFQEAVELVLAGGFLLFVLGTERWASRASRPGRPTGSPLPALRSPAGDPLPDPAQDRAKASLAWSASRRAMASDAVAAGDGAFSTWRAFSPRSSRKSSTIEPSTATACARTPEGPNSSWSLRTSGT